MRRPARVATAVVLVLTGVFGLGAALGQLGGPLPLPAWLAGWWDRPGGVAPAASRPVRIEVAALGIQARVHPVGLDARGAIAAPSLRRAHEAGWYEDGPAPGQHGAAVIVGHVDGARGPAVFHDLASARPGTRIEITRRDRQVTVFEITDVRWYDKAALPADEVYGDFAEPGLRLITCGGQWVGGDVGYDQNVVVFATLVP